jgi:hypothetical protein
MARTFDRKALIDPDGHHLVLVDPLTSKMPSRAKATTAAGLPPVSAKPE